MEFESKITYTRHIVAEAYLWALGTYFEPEYSQARVALAIIVILYTALDDVYDAYGTKEELEIFTHALKKYSFCKNIRFFIFFVCFQCLTYNI